ncbi:MAG: diheme cytochrome c [Burkholderiaceae bacterium]|nr:diheme cytochrome c [Burkholderiaceae bacterium]
MSSTSFLPPWHTVIATTALAFGLLGNAQADSGRAMPRNVPNAYTQECGACHTAYPPSMLPARSWQRTMDGLNKHFGTDAALDTATTQQLNAWLQAHAGTYKRVREEPPQDRLTRSAWFERKHRKIDPSVWQHPSIKSAAQCGTCHTRADEGDYDDDNVRFPAGISTSMQQSKNDWKRWIPWKD